jgi:hypothetical protein
MVGRTPLILNELRNLIICVFTFTIGSDGSVVPSGSVHVMVLGLRVAGVIA